MSILYFGYGSNMPKAVIEERVAVKVDSRAFAHRTTAGYAHVADAHLVEAADKVGAIIATAMASQRPRPITHRQ